MLDKAVMEMENCIVCAREREIYNNDINVTCNALSMLFVKSNLTEMNGGTIFSSWLSLTQTKQALLLLQNLPRLLSIVSQLCPMNWLHANYYYKTILISL